VIQFVLAHDFDSDLKASLAVDSFVNVGECTITHLFDESETLESLNVSVEKVCSKLPYLVHWHLFALRSFIRDDLLGLLSVVW
jgi:hypothetical protein